VTPQPSPTRPATWPAGQDLGLDSRRGHESAHRPTAPRLAGQGHDHGPLAHSTGQLVGKCGLALPGRISTARGLDSGHRRRRPGLGECSIGDLVTDDDAGSGWCQALEIMASPAPDGPRSPPRRQVDQFPAVQRMGPVAALPVRREAHQEPGGDRLAQRSHRPAPGARPRRTGRPRPPGPSRSRANSILGSGLR
jgi:hypothetical protein